MTLDNKINDFFGLEEPEKKDEPKQEKSIQERVDAFRGSSQLALGKSTEYFEEAYKLVEPTITDELVKEVEEETFYEEMYNLDDMSIEELESLAEQKTKEIEIEQIAEIGKQSLNFEYKSNPDAQILESVDTYRSALDRVKVQEEELIDPEKFRLNEMDRKIIAISNSLEGMKGYINESTLVSGIGQGGDGQLPGGGEVLLRGLDDVNIGNICVTYCQNI